MTSQFLITLLLLTAITLTSAAEFGRPLNHELKELKKKEHLTHFKFYWHEVIGGNNDTASQIIQPIPKYKSIGSFGGLRVIDTPLTLGPKLSSKLVGRAEGLYAATSQTKLELLMIQTINFFEGKYNGSAINVLGRNVVLDKKREMPVVGGSGVFRFAKGYVELSTYSFDPKSGSSIVEYNLYVLHY